MSPVRPAPKIKAVKASKLPSVELGPPQTDEGALIRKQLAWLAAMVILGLAGYMGWQWGQDHGWGNVDKAVAYKFKRAEEAFVSGRVDQAVAQYQGVVDRYPQNAQIGQALTQLAASQQQLGQLTEAQAALDNLLKRLEGDGAKADLRAYTLLQIGKVKKEKADYDGALQAFARVRSEHPKTDWSGEAQSGIGAVYQAQRHFKEARQAYALLLKETPGGFLAAEAQTAIGACYEADGDTRSAIKAYKAVIEKYPAAVWDSAKARLERLDKEYRASDHAAQP